MPPHMLDGSPAPPGTPDAEKVTALVPLLRTLLMHLESHEKYQTPLPKEAESITVSLYFTHVCAKQAYDIMEGMKVGMDRAIKFMEYYTARVLQMGDGDELPKRPPRGFSKVDPEVDEVIMNETEFDPRITMAMAQVSGMRLLFEHEIGGYLKENKLQSMHKIYKDGMGRCTTVGSLCGDARRLGDIGGVHGEEIDLGEDIKRAGAAILAEIEAQ
ncbi:hypothetical protein AA313_de0202851 [Arthrobotrys entomopaga]|nr:hypothetical protein AA313_de0202851 [Arthrobotrys entomopaga]